MGYSRNLGNKRLYRLVLHLQLQSADSMVGSVWCNPRKRGIQVDTAKKSINQSI